MTSSHDPLEPRIDWVRDHHREYVATNGLKGHVWNGVPTLLLTTRGRRSGALRRTPLIYGRDGERYLVVASYGGAPTHPDWYLNLRDDPDVEIQVGPDAMRARATTVDDAERERLWPVMTAVWPDYDHYQAKTDRTIPIVALEPAL
jgi:deazaflavin-dependent oxidoreductase (nitroreductase family)